MHLGERVRKRKEAAYAAQLILFAECENERLPVQRALAGPARPGGNEAERTASAVRAMEGAVAFSHCRIHEIPSAGGTFVRVDREGARSIHVPCGTTRKGLACALNLPLDRECHRTRRAKYSCNQRNPLHKSPLPSRRILPNR